MIHKLLRPGIAVLLGLMFLAPAYAQQRASISGRITDAASGLPLEGANVVLANPATEAMVAGAATGAAGEYAIADVEPGSYVLFVRFVGYGEVRTEVTLAAGERRTYSAALEPAGFDLNTVVVTASRQEEKALDAPASISVLGPREIESDVTLSSAAVLRNTTGVDMAQTGVDRYELVLRGFNNAFSGASYVLTDYRQSAIASLAVNAHNMMPTVPIDLERIEVVRGPGSALYGAGVDAGVIHFITKDPFTHPGTTVSVGGGERSMFMGSFRHAGAVNNRIGYKLVGQYTRAEEWNFDPNDPLDNVQLCSFRTDIDADTDVQVTCPAPGGPSTRAVSLDYNNWKANINGTVAYRFSSNVTLTANGGFATAKSIFLSGIGTLQADGFGYTFGQLRFQAGRFFAQTYINKNNAGDSFVYRDTAVEDVVDNSTLITGQAQYDLGLARDRVRLIVGGDYFLTTPDTEGTINGRNEPNDQIAEIGGYAQASTAITPKLDLVLAARGDYHNVIDAFQVSPRAAVVFKPVAGQSVRATYNQAFSSPGSNSLFLDINAGAAGPLTLRARGAAHGFHFQRNGDGNLIGSSLRPAAFGQPAPIGIPLGAVYGQVYSAIASIPTAQLREMLEAQGIVLTEQQVAGLVGLLSPQAGTNVQGLTDSQLGFLNLSSLKIDRFAEDLVDIGPLQQTISHTFELGYKGLFQNRVLVAVDGYYARKKNFVGPLQVESPFILAPAPASVIADLQGAMASGIAGNAQLKAQLDALQLSPEAVAAILAGFSQQGLQASLPAEGSPIGIVQPAENAIPGQLLLSYRNYGEISYFGVDVGTEVIASDRLRGYANLSWVSDNFFEEDELGEEGTGLQLAMNAPQIKVKGGFDYRTPGGLGFNASVRHIGEYEVRSGPYSGVVESYTLVDLGAGYDLDRYVSGLRVDLSVHNAFDNVRREFIGAPKMGRISMLRLTYTR